MHSSRTAPTAPRPNGRLRAGLATVLTLAVAAGLWAYWDYHRWLALGPGGVPYDLDGWRQVTWLRLQKKDPLGTAELARLSGHPGDLQTLGALPPRAGRRPRVAPHPIPHRQLDQHGDAGVRLVQRQLFDRAVADDAALVTYRKSRFERRNGAMFLRDGAAANRLAGDAGGEIAHIHPSDGSMHMTLGPSDARRVIEAGWGELHPLVGVPLGGGRVLPATYMLVYSPRDTAELRIVERILHAAVRYAAGRG